MSVTNNLKKQYDTPVWEWTRFAPVANTAISNLACGDLPRDSRYLYYIVSAAFYRYDTWTDSWMQLASPNTTPLVYTAMKFSSYGGFRGRILEVPSNTTLIIPALADDVLKGEIIRIYGGTGANQTRTILDVQEPTVYDSGIATATTNANQIQDTLKKWKWNQWSGYQVRVIYGTGNTQIRKVLYNDANTLYFFDVNYQQIDSWNNQPFSAVAPYFAPVSTAGSQAQYVIEASLVTLDSAWDVNPDTNSRFSTHSGGIWLVSQTASGAFHSLQYYDIASDIWFTKTATAGLLLAAPGTDISMERISNRGGIYGSSTGTTGTTKTIVDYNLTGVTSGDTTNTVDRFVNCQVRIMKGTGLGQRRRITANNNNTIWVNRNWDTIPDNTSEYEIWDDVFMMYYGGFGASSIFQYHSEADLACQGSVYDYGLVRNMSVRLNGWEDIGVASATRNVNGITGINTSPVAGGTGHVVGDIVTLGTGTLGKVYIEAVTTGGVATLVSLIACGTNYTVSTCTQSATTGAGTGLQIGVTSIGTIGKLATSINHNIKIGNTVTYSGAVDSAWNTSFTVLGVDSLTSIEFITTAAANAVIANTTSVSVMVDSAANWVPGEHIGKLVEIAVAGSAPTTQIRRITANTATTLTLQSNVTLPVTGTSRYIIHDPYMLGRDEQYKFNKTQRGNTGWALSGTTFSMADNTKSWLIDQWAACKVRIISGTGYDKGEFTITGNTTNTLNFSGAGLGFTPDTTTKYIIFDSFGLCTSTGSGTVLNDTTKKWIVNQWAGKRVRITSGTAVGTEVTIVSNTATQLTAAAGMGTPDNTSTYTILGIPTRGTGSNGFLHIHSATNPLFKGRYLFSPRGGGLTTADILDLRKEVWEYGNFFSPQSETLTTGSMYTYDGQDIIYFTKDATGRIYSYDINTHKISNAGTIPYGMGAALIGNRMEVIETADGLKYLYVMRHSGTEMFRCLIFWQ
jgi:hypothetical protein